MSLMQAYEQSLRNRPSDGKYGAFDARVLAKYNDHWITSPNVDYVPQPFIFEGARVELLRDGRMGHIDCFQWPQLHAERYWLWWNITQSVEDFVLERGSAFKVGRIHVDKWKLLEIAYNRLDERAQDWMRKYPHYDGPLKVDAWLRSCRRCLLRLKQLPFTFRDTVILVTFCQRLCLDVFGMLEYLGTVLPAATGSFIDAFDRWMGAFTTDPGICQHLFEIRIPVWLIWKPDRVPEDMRVLKEVEVTCPDDIVTDSEDFEVGQVLKWTGGWCYPGDARHLHTREGAVIGLEQFACPWPEPSAQSSSGATASMPASTSTAASNLGSSSSVNSNTGAIRVDRPRERTRPYPPTGSRPRAKPSVTPNAELWEDFDDPAIPPAISAWYAALKDVNKDAKMGSSRRTEDSLLFPSPSPVCEGRVFRSQAETHPPLPPRSWRDFLNTIPEQISSTFSGDRLREAAKLFGPALIRVQHDIPSQVQFRDISISLADLASIDQLMKSKVLWDLYEHNFRFELVALTRVLMPALSLNQESEWLDRVRQVFPGDSELTMCAEPFPSENQGLGSSDLQSKRKYVERLRGLLALWPGFPSDLVEPLLPSASSARVWAVERKLAAFYIQLFFDNFGRPPILPRFIPVPSQGR
ncbi:hypothetical protein EDC04DRAFT_2898259 [Pisolithus marmoratus]|nr:hypothetical protein EDC04DRAFT_2898259 [Pisolithus marmoratus]